MEGSSYPATGTPSGTGRDVELAHGIGATHLSLNTMGCGLGKLDDHIAAMTAFAEVVFAR